MAWGSKPGETCYMSNYQAGQVVDYPEVEGGCDHAVLIVGYTPTYWIVRNSHGRDWGNKGHFRIKKGINSCGIEQNMAVLVVSPRDASKGLAANGCPSDKPNLCRTTHACTGGSGCARPIALLEVKKKEVATSSFFFRPVAAAEEIVEEIVAEEEEVEEIVAEEEEVEEIVAEEEIVEEIVAEEEEVEELQERQARIPGELEKRDARIPGKLEKREARIPGEKEKRETNRIPGEREKREGRVPGEREKRDEEEEKRFHGGADHNLGKRDEDRRRPKNNRGKNPKS